MQSHGMQSCLVAASTSSPAELIALNILCVRQAVLMHRGKAASAPASC